MSSHIIPTLGGKAGSGVRLSYLPKDIGKLFDDFKTYSQTEPRETAVKTKKDFRFSLRTFVTSIRKFEQYFEIKSLSSTLQNGTQDTDFTYGMLSEKRTIRFTDHRGSL